MFSYNWSGIDRKGKKIWGTDQASNNKQLKNILIKKNILPLKIKLNLISIFKLYPKIKTKHINHLIEQLTVLIGANTPLIKAITITHQDELNPELKNLLINCTNSLLDGKSLAQTWQQYPRYFTSLMCSIVNIGEQSGTLDAMLGELTNHLKKVEAQKHKIIKAMLYPTVILGITIITTIILLIFVIPQFAIMFDSLGAKLPSYTRFIINFSTLLQKSWHYILAGIINIIFGIKLGYRHLEGFRQTLDKFYLKIPLVKNILNYAIIFRLTKTLGLTLKSGIPLLAALNISAATVSNYRYQVALQKTKQLIASGKPLHRALWEQNLFPTKMIQLIALGEETGSLDLMLNKIAIIYNDELNHLSDNFNNLLEPTIMLILGIIVGGLVIGMYLPIFRLGMVI